jgi:GTPase SAR1 family protein
VGKTSIHTRFIHQSFSSQWNHTIGAEFVSKTIELGGRRLKLQGCPLARA